MFEITNQVNTIYPHRLVFSFHYRTMYLNNNLELNVFNFHFIGRARVCVCMWPIRSIFMDWVLLLLIQLNNFYSIERFSLEKHSSTHAHWKYTLSRSIVLRACAFVCSLCAGLSIVQWIRIAISLCLKKLKWKACADEEDENERKWKDTEWRGDSEKKGSKNPIHWIPFVDYNFFSTAFHFTSKWVGKRVFVCPLLYSVRTHTHTHIIHSPLIFIWSHLLFDLIRFMFVWGVMSKCEFQ